MTSVLPIFQPFSRPLYTPAMLKANSMFWSAAATVTLSLAITVNVIGTLEAMGVDWKSSHQYSENGAPHRVCYLPYKILLDTRLQRIRFPSFHNSTITTPLQRSSYYRRQRILRAERNSRMEHTFPSRWWICSPGARTSTVWCVNVPPAPLPRQDAKGSGTRSSKRVGAMAYSALPELCPADALMCVE